MTEIPVQRAARFAELSEDERTIVHFALQQTAKRIMDKAADDEYAAEDLAAAGGTFLATSRLAAEVGKTLGFEPGNDESLQIAALCIAEGSAPMAAKFAAEVEAEPVEIEDNPRLGIGANGDVPVSLEEDDHCAGDVNACAEICADEGCQA